MRGEEANQKKPFVPRGGQQNNRGGNRGAPDNRGNDQEVGKRKFIRR
jgi:hypothetical protein